MFKLIRALFGLVSKTQDDPGSQAEVRDRFIREAVEMGFTDDEIQEEVRRRFGDEELKRWL